MRVRAYLLAGVLALAAGPASAQLSQASNGAAGTLSTGYSAAATTIVLTAGHGARFPATSGGTYYVRVNNITDYPASYNAGFATLDPQFEFMRVTSHTAGSDTFIVDRGTQGTAASAKNTPGKTYGFVLAFTAADITAINTGLQASALTLATNGTLTNERVFTVGTGLSGTDGGAGSTYTLGIATGGVTYSLIQNVSANSVLARAAGSSGSVGEVAVGASQLFGRGATGDLTAITLGTNLSMSGSTLNATGGGGGAPTTSQYVTLALDGSLSAERVLTAGTAIGFTDTGANGTLTVAVNDVELTSVAALTSAADRLPYYTGSGTAALATFTAGGRALVNSAGTANTFPYFSASNTVTLGAITAAGLAILDDANAAAQLTTLGAQPLDATLTAWAAFNTNGVLVQTAADTFTARTLTGTPNQVTVTNGSGVAGNPTFSLPQDIHTGASPTFVGATLTGLTNTRIPYVSTGGLVADDSEMLWDATNNVLKLSSAWGMTRDALGLQIQRTVTTPLDATPGAVRPILAVRGTFAGSGKVSQGRIGMYSYVEDDASVRNVTITNAVDEDGAGAGTEIRLTATGHGFATGDTVNVYGVVGTVEANNAWTITVIDANTIDLQGSTFTNAYVSGGTITNRGLMYALSLDVKPIIDRDTFLLQNLGQNGDDVAGLTISNSGQTATATDAIWITDAGTALRKAWHSILASDSGVNYFISYYGKVYAVGIDLSGATLNTGAEPMLKLGSGHNIDLDSAGSGTKIGLSTSDKLGFWNATPIVQPSSTAELKDGVLAAAGLMGAGGAASLDLDGGPARVGSLGVNIAAPSPAGAVSLTGTNANFAATDGTGAAVQTVFYVQNIQTSSGFTSPLQAVTFETHVNMSSAPGGKTINALRPVLQTAANATSYASDTFRAINPSVTHNGSGDVSQMVANQGTFQNNSTGGTIATAVSMNAVNNNNGSGTITNAYWYRALGLTNNGTITNTYGIHIGDITAGTQTNAPYGFYLADTENARNFFGSAAFNGFGTASPLTKLHVEGTNGWALLDEQDADPTSTQLDSLDSGAIYFKNNKLVIAYNNGGTITYVTIPLDGSTTTWTHNTTAP